MRDTQNYVHLAAHGLTLWDVASARFAGDRLIDLSHGPGHEATDRSIDVQVMRLRRLIEADPAEPKHIRTVWGVGYVFVPETGSPATMTP